MKGEGKMCKKRIRPTTSPYFPFPIQSPLPTLSPRLPGRYAGIAPESKRLIVLSREDAL